MPVLVETGDSFPSDAEVLDIGLLNNLSDAGLEGGERQFIDLLTKAAGTRRVRLRLFSLPEIVRGANARQRIDKLYTKIESLFGLHLDGLIVTGCEPHTARLQDEPYWHRLTDVMDWAERGTHSTVWSCLAAHAAVLHLDGIERRRLPEKLSGVFDVERVGEHPLLAGSSNRLQVPHSRYNGLVERDLSEAGYEVLTRSTAVGVDAFTRQGRSLFVFLQGHPEYDAAALQREYRRDVMRYLDGTSETYPAIPANTVSREMETALRAFATQAHLEREPDLFTGFPLGMRRGAGGPRTDELAVTLFTNWLAVLHAKTPEHAA